MLNQLFEQLRSKTNQEQLDKRAKEVEARLLAQFEKQERRIAEIVTTANHLIGPSTNT